jgi:hypothetical protein
MKFHGKYNEKKRQMFMKIFMEFYGIPWKNIMKKPSNVYENFYKIPWKIP